MSAIVGLARKLKFGGAVHSGSRLMAWCVGNAKEEQGQAVGHDQQIRQRRREDRPADGGLQRDQAARDEPGGGGRYGCRCSCEPALACATARRQRRATRRRSRTATLPQTPLPQITRGNPAWDEFFGGVPGLPAITEQTAMLISAVYACVNLIAGVISALPAIIYREQPDGEREQLFNDDLRWVLNEQFTPRWSAAVGWEYLVQSLLLPGDSMAIILRKGGLQSGAIAGIEPVHPNCVTVLATPDRMRLIYAVRRPDGALEVYDQDDFCTFPASASTVTAASRRCAIICG
jgi:hypothetical protein